MGKIINSPETVIPDYVSLRQVYEGVRIPDEDEAIWMIGEARLDDYYKVVKFNPMKEGKEFVSWNGVRFGSIRHFVVLPRLRKRRRMGWFHRAPDRERRSKDHA